MEPSKAWTRFIVEIDTKNYRERENEATVTKAMLTKQRDKVIKPSPLIKSDPNDDTSKMLPSGSDSARNKSNWEHLISQIIGQIDQNHLFK